MRYPKTHKEWGNIIPDGELMQLNQGLYGLRFTDIKSDPELFVAPPAQWQPWTIVRREGPGEPVDGLVGSDSARLRLAPHGSLVIDRTNRTSVFTMRTPPSDAQLAHPYLAATAAIAARWDGRESFHAGAFVIGGRVWGVLGEREMGKSSLLAVLARLELPVLTDDVLVLRDGLALAGPRCIDLREEAARRLRMGRTIGPVGTRERWRIMLPAVAPELPLAGWISLEWADRTGIESVPPGERFPRLLDNLTVVLDPLDPPIVLTLAALPMVTLRRPRSFDALTASAQLLVAELERM